MTDDTLVWVVIALFITLELELVAIGGYWLYRNVKRKQAKTERKSAAKTYSFAPLFLAGFFASKGFQIFAIIFLTLAIIGVALYNCYYFYKKRRLHQAKNQPQTQVGVEQDLSIQADAQRPLAIKLPVCQLSISDKQPAESALTAENLQSGSAKAIDIMSFDGEVTGSIYPVVVADANGVELGSVQPIIVESGDGDVVQPIEQVNADQGEQEIATKSLCLSNIQGQPVGCIKPLIIKDVSGKVVGFAKLPIVNDDDGRISGIARPIVVVDKDGNVEGTTAPTITFENGKPMQSVVIFGEKEEVAIPMTSVQTEVAHSAEVELPNVIVANAFHEKDKYLVVEASPETSGVVSERTQPEPEQTPAPQPTMQAQPTVEQKVIDGESAYNQPSEKVDNDDIEVVQKVDQLTREVTIIRYNKSFTAKLIQSSDEVKSWYGKLKNEVMSYDRVWNRVWWSHDNINIGKERVAKFVIEDGVLYMHFALNPDEYKRKFHVTRTEKTRYDNVPCVMCIDSDEAVDEATRLFAIFAKKLGIVRGETKRDNYYLPYETTDELLEKKLMREIYRETVKKDIQTA